MVWNIPYCVTKICLSVRYHRNKLGEEIIRTWTLDQLLNHYLEKGQRPFFSPKHYVLCYR